MPSATSNNDLRNQFPKSGFFSSARERRLWGWTGATIVAIYATLGLASTLAQWLYHQQLSAFILLACMFLIGVTILTQGLSIRPGGLEIGVAVGIAVVYFMVFFRLTVTERSHMIEYSVLASFIYEALKERKKQGRNVPWPPLLAVLAASFVGVVDELLQLFIPNRHFDQIDILFNFLASLMAVVSMVILNWARRLTMQMLNQRSNRK